MLSDKQPFHRVAGLLLVCLPSGIRKSPLDK